MNIVQDNIEKLKEIFPEIFTEGKIDFEVLKQLLGEKIETDKERYSFTWKGKTEARQVAQDTSTGTLRPSKEDSKDWDNTENLYIEGDNLEVLKLLQKSYHGKIKMIYIDPPYNTGKDFVYKDNFKDNLKNYLEVTGQLGEEGQRLSTNSDSSGRYHSDWLNMMYPRLKLARNLLTDDGVIFISIDDKEQENLIKICNEIFGDENKLGILVWKKKYTGGKGTNTFVDYHEYILSYSKNRNLIGEIEMDRPDEEKDKFIMEDEYLEERGRFYIRPLKSNLDLRPTLIYPIELPDKKTITTQWICAKDTYEELKSQGRILIKQKNDGNYQVYKKFYEKDGGGKIKIPSFLEISSNNEAKEELKQIFNIVQTRDLPFQTPKPIKLLEFFIKNFSKKDDYILDFFSGSASTAHAVMQLNAEDGGDRKYIMVQLPEICDEKSEAYKAGYKNICEIGKERIRRAGEKIKEELEKENSQLKLGEECKKVPDIGFKVFKLDSSNIKEWDSETDNLKQMLLDSVDNIKLDRTSLDVLYEILLKYGLDLNVPIEKNKDFYSIGGGTLLVNLNKEIEMEVIDSICEEYRNLLEIDEDFKTTVILRDSAFKNDVDKTNAMKKLEQAGIKEVRSI